MLIVFSGTDGAGKSTQIERLIKHYELNGAKTVYLWSRGGYTPGISLLKNSVRKILGKKLPSAGQSKNRDEILEKKSVSTVWLSLAIIDLILLYGLYIRWQSLLGRVVVCDRYVQDTYLDFTNNFADSFNSKSFLWKLLNILIPKPDKSFLLFVPVNISQERSLLKNEPFPDSEETLIFRLNKYLDENIFPSPTYTKIDCQISIEDVHQQIINELK
jgi:dTMP kinase